MKCQKCSEEATLQFTELEDNVPHTLWFCAQHGRQYARETEFPNGERSFDDRIPLTVPVTQAKIDGEETVNVDLPRGGKLGLKVQKGWRDGTVISTFSPGRTGKPGLRLKIKVVG